MATTLPSTSNRRMTRRRRENAVIAEAAEILLDRLRREGRLKTPGEAEAYLRMRLATQVQEELLAIWLDAHHRIIASEVIARGTVDHAAVDARGVAQRALEHNARALILAHNHPSGDALPSAEDIALTARLRAGLTLFDVRLLAHYIVGDVVLRVD